MSLAEQIVKSLGIDPNALREALNRVVATAQRVDANMIAAQDAIKQATAHFDRRFDALEKAMGVQSHAAAETVFANLENTPQTGPLKLKTNGAAQHDGPSAEPEPDAGSGPAAT